jgi:hypothetical protein
MALLFDNASSEYIQNNATNVTAAPLTIATWFNTDELGGSDRYILTISSSSDANDSDSFRIGYHTVASVHQFQIEAREGASQGASAITGVSINTWHHGAGIFVSGTSRTAYLDGAAASENTQDRVPANLDRTTIGTMHGGTANIFGEWSGLVAETGIWNVALTAGEITMLSLGASPMLIRPQSLVFYCPIIGKNDPEPEIIGGLNMTYTNTPVVADHVPTIFYPMTLPILYPSAVAPPSVTEFKRRFIIALPG